MNRIIKKTIDSRPIQFVKHLLIPNPMWQLTNLLIRLLISSEPVLKQSRALSLTYVWMLMYSTAVMANPNGAEIVHGHVSISANGSNLSIHQGSQTAIINWQDFSIDAGELTEFIQNNGDAAVLNRVISNNISAIQGSLKANGKVFLINQNGVVIGSSGSIDTQSFVASTLDVSNSDFLNHIEQGQALTFSGDSSVTIINLGQIHGEENVFLIAQNIENHGEISAGSSKERGSVGLGAGSTVSLLSEGQDKIRIDVAGDDVNIDQQGLIEATQIELRAAHNNPYALAINHEGISRANSVVHKNGRIILMAEGTANVDGAFDASAPIEGNGGFIETSATHIDVADTVSVNTSATNGETGTWLIDPEDIEINSTQTIAGASVINASTIETNLQTTNVVIETDDGLAGDGDITINQAINALGSANSLSLDADRNILVSQDVSLSGNLDLQSGGNITGSGVLTANDINLTANSQDEFIGTAVQAINTNASGVVTASANNGSGGIYVSNLGDLSVGDINAGSGDAEITAVDGELTTGVSLVSFMANNITLATTEQVGNNTVGDRNIVIGSGGIVGTGTVLALNSADDVIVAGAINAGSFSATAGNGKDGTGLFDLASDPNAFNDGRTGSDGESGGQITVTSMGSVTTFVGDLILIAGRGGNGAFGENGISGADNTGDAGNGGGTGGDGGVGGNIQIDGALTSNQALSVTAGSGGHGGTGGEGIGTGGNSLVDGNGGNSGGTGGNGGAAGSVTVNMTLNSGQALSLIAGAGGYGGLGGRGHDRGGNGLIGGNSGGKGGDGGAGGSVTVNAEVASDHELALVAGSGGVGGNGGTGDGRGGQGDITSSTGGTSGGTAGHGGTGGEITIAAALSSQQNLSLSAGLGGNGGFAGDGFSNGGFSDGHSGGSGGNGGDGGDITISAELSSQQGLSLNAGAGGNGGLGSYGDGDGGGNGLGSDGSNSGGTGGNGGAGGNITLSSTLNAQQDLSLSAGAAGHGGTGGRGNGNGGDTTGFNDGNSGGTGGHGGMGGSIIIDAALNTQQNLSLIAGAGGNGGDGGVGMGAGGGFLGTSGGMGGDGGSGGSITLNAALDTQQDLSLSTGAGGIAGVGGSGLGPSGPGMDGDSGIGGQVVGSQIDLSALGGSIAITGLIAPDAGSSVSLLAGTQAGQTLGFNNGFDLTGDGSLHLQGFNLGLGSNFSTENGDITLNSGDGSMSHTGLINAGNGDLTLVSTGDISSAQILSGNNLYLTVTGSNSSIGSSGVGAIQANATGNFNASAANGSGGVFISQQGDFDLSNVVLDAGTGGIEITAHEGSLTTGTSAFNFTGASLLLATTEDANGLNSIYLPEPPRNLVVGSGGINATGAVVSLSSADDLHINGAINADSVLAQTTPDSFGAAQSGTTGTIVVNDVITSAQDIVLTTSDTPFNSGGSHGGSIIVNHALIAGSQIDMTTGSGHVNGGSIQVNQSLTAAQNINMSTGSGGHGANGGDGAVSGSGEDGGNGANGGHGGSIAINALVESQVGDIVLNTGNGGDGGLGGNGGFGVTHSGGDGGDGGHGGRGGSVIATAAVNSGGQIVVTAGAGGKIGLEGAGGTGSNGIDGTAGNITGTDRGGNIQLSTVDAVGDVTLTAGASYDGALAGDVIFDGELSTQGNVIANAGTGQKLEIGYGFGGFGGNVKVNQGLYADGEIQLLAGDGGDRFSFDIGGGFAIYEGEGGDGGDVELNAAVRTQQSVTLSAGQGGDLNGGDGDIRGSQIDVASASGDISVIGLINADAGGSVSLSALHNINLDIAQNFNLTGEGDLFLQANGFNSGNTFSTEDGDITIDSRNGDLVLDSGFSAMSTGSGNVVLASGGNFHNDSGSVTPVSVNGGRFVVYSTRPDNNRNDIGTDANAIAHDFVQYGLIYDTANPFPSPLALGNGFVYSVQPVLTGVNVNVNNQTVDYGQNIDVNDFNLIGSIPGTYQVGGLAINDAEFELSSPGTITEGNIALALDSSVGISSAGFAEAGSYSNGIEAVFSSGNSHGLALNGSGNLIVNVIDLNVTLAAEDKLYDATTDVVVNIVNDDRVVGDVLSVDFSTGNFDDKNVAIDKAVSVSGVTLTGVDAANYSLVSNADSLSANISVADLFVTGAIAGDKVYDGTTVAIVNGGSVAALAGDVLSVSLDSANFDDKNVGSNKSITAVYSLSGADAGNYNLIQPTALQADITQRDLSFGVSGNDKVYDGTILATGSSFDDRIAGDSLSFSHTGFLFDDENVGANKTVSVSFITLGGADAGNYNLLSTTASDQADITPAALSITANDDSKTYDGLAYTAAQGVSYSGFVGGESESDLSGSLVIGGDAVGAINAGSYTLAASGLSSGNYDISYVDGSLTVNQTQLNVVLNDDVKKADGIANSGGNGFVFDGFVNGEDETILAGSIVYGGSSQGAINPGFYTIEGSGLVSNNYAISYLAGELEIQAPSVINELDHDSQEAIARQEIALTDSPSISLNETGHLGQKQGVNKKGKKASVIGQQSFENEPLKESLLSRARSW